MKSSTPLPSSKGTRSAKGKQQFVRKGMRLSIIDGVFAQIYQALCQIGSSFVTKFLVILGATPFQFSLLSALGQVSALFQPLGLALTHRLKARKWACVWITAAGRFLTFFTAAALLFSSQNTAIWFVLALLFSSASLLAIGGNIWIAWISDLIPQNIRGRFFSRRNQIVILAGLIVGYIFSLYIDMFEATSGLARSILVDGVGLGKWFIPANQPYFISGMFIFGSLISFIGLYVLSRQPERIVKAEPIISLRKEYSQPFKDVNFRKLLIFGMWWMLAIGVGSAFWGHFMIQKLKMGMFTMQLYGTLHNASSLVAFTFWGRFVDRLGNKTAMKFCVVLGGLNPMLWLFTGPGNYSILWMEAVISGIMWTGNTIVATNFVLAIAPKGKQQVYSGLYGALAGVSMMTSTLLSGAFFPGHLDLGWKVLEPEQVVFGIGGILRWLTIIPLLFVVEKKAVPLRHVLAYALRSVMEGVSDLWQSIIKRV